MIEFSVSTNAESVNKVVVNIVKKIGNLEKPLKRVGIYMLGSIHRNFALQGRPIKWPALSLMSRQKRRGGLKGRHLILQDTGRLRSSIVYELEGNTGVRIGTNIPYARKLHFGGVNVMSAHTESVRSHVRIVGEKRVIVKPFRRRVGKRQFTVPGRPFVLFQNEDVIVIERIFSDYVQEVLGGK